MPRYVALLLIMMICESVRAPPPMRVTIDCPADKRGAYEQTAHLMVSDHRRPWTLATPGVSQMRCRPLRQEYVLFLKVLGSYWSGNTAGDNIFHSFVVRGKKFRQKRTVVDSHASR
ncbi:hypothetical protein evm_001372 [Chilo suppressalis]|nr:hypothetical protein evm_001372 [Chilo suppressalis]